MRPLAIAVSVAGLLLSVVPAFLVFEGALAWPAYTTLLALGMVIWFASAPFWMRTEAPLPPPEPEDAAPREPSS